MEMKSYPILILGALMAFIGFFSTLILLAYIPLALVQHISLLSAFLLQKMDLQKEDCLGLILPILVLYWISVVNFIVLWIAGVGVAFAQEWARKVLVVLAWIDLIWVAGDFIFAHKHANFENLIEPVVMLGIIVFLSLSGTKEKFKKDGEISLR